MSFTDSTNPEPTDVNPPPVNPNQPQDPLASPQGPIPRRPMNWPNQTLPQLAGQWDPTQTTQDPNNPNAVAPDQTINAGGFTSGTPGPFMLAAAMPAGPYGPFGPRPFAMHQQQRFIPGAPNRPFEEWGTPREYPVMPQMWEIPGIYSGLGNQLSQWGPGYVQPFAAMMGMGSGAWMRGYMRGQAALTNQQYQQMRMASYETERRMQEIASEYGQIFAIFGDGQHPEQLKQALRNAAEKFHDEHMKQALEMGLSNAETLARWYESKHGDLHVTNRQREKDEEERKALEPYQQPGQPGASGVPSTAPPPVPTEPQPEAPTPAPPTPGAEPDEGTPTSTPGIGLPPVGVEDTQPAQTQQAAAPTRPPVQLAMRGDTMSDAPSPGVGDVDQPVEPTREAGDGLGGVPRLTQADTTPGAARTPATTPAAAPTAPAAADPYFGSNTLRQAATGQYRLRPDLINTMAQTALKTGKVDKSLPKPVQQAVLARAAEIGAGLDEIAADDKITPAQARARIKALAPSFAGTLDGYVSGSVPIPARDFPMKDRIVALGQKIDPTFNAQQAQVRAANLKDITSGQSGRALASGVTSFDHIQLVQGLQKGIPYDPWKGPAGNRLWQDILADKMPDVLMSADQQRQRLAIQQYKATIDLVAPDDRSRRA